MAKIAYKRVSTTDQNLDRQLKDITFDKEFCEKVGARKKREQLELMLDYIREGDEIHVHQLSRIARSILDFNRIVEVILQKKAHLIVHKENLIFRADREPSATEKLQHTILSAIAQFEMDLSKEMQAEGIAQAKKAGKYKGRRSLFTNERLINFKRDWKNAKSEGLTRTEVAKRYGITLQYAYKLYKKESF